MGYLDNSSIIVDAILTKKGRELLSRQDGSFQITQFALADDEIDYTLFNENHPNGSAYSGEAIENLPLLEAFPDENNIMVSKLVTLPRGTSKMPIVTANVSKITLSLGSTTSLNPTTLNFNGVSNLTEPNGYIATIADRRLLQLGLKPNFGISDNPLTWWDEVIGVEHQNFFEGRASAYTKASVKGNWSNVFDDTE